jgi:hypothetical protein
MQPLVQAASRTRIANAEGLQAHALEPLALGRVGHERVEHSFFLDMSSAARLPLLNIDGSPVHRVRGLAYWAQRSRRRGPCCPSGLDNGLVGGGPEDALLKQPLTVPALAGLSIRRCRRIFIQWVYNLAGVSLGGSRPLRGGHELAEFKGVYLWSAIAGSCNRPVLVCLVRGWPSRRRRDASARTLLMTALPISDNQVHRCSDLDNSAFLNHRRIANEPNQLWSQTSAPRLSLGLR